MTELPRARVLHGVIEPPSRRVPRRLVWRLWFALTPQVQVSWFFLDFGLGNIARAAGDSTLVREYRAAPGNLVIPMVVIGAVIAFGLSGVVRGIARGRQAVHLLRHGHLMTGRIVKREATSRNNTRLTFEYELHGTHRVTVDAGRDTRRLEDDRNEPMLVDVVEPSNAMLLDSLPAGSALARDGALDLHSGTLVEHLLVLPALAVVALGALLIAGVR